MEEIAAASREQSDGIHQINSAVADMNQVTQQNAANAEELASVMSMFRVENGHTQAGGHIRKTGRGSGSRKARRVTSRDPETVIPMQESGKF